VTRVGASLAARAARTGAGITLLRAITHEQKRPLVHLPVQHLDAQDALAGVVVSSVFCVGRAPPMKNKCGFFRRPLGV
jgi:hypothetical protein